MDLSGLAKYRLGRQSLSAKHLRGKEETGSAGLASWTSLMEGRVEAFWPSRVYAGRWLGVQSPNWTTRSVAPLCWCVWVCVPRNAFIQVVAVVEIWADAAIANGIAVSSRLETQDMTAACRSRAVDNLPQRIQSIQGVP